MPAALVLAGLRAALCVLRMSRLARLARLRSRAAHDDLIVGSSAPDDWRARLHVLVPALLGEEAAYPARPVGCRRRITAQLA